MNVLPYNADFGYQPGHAHNVVDFTQRQEERRRARERQQMTRLECLMDGFVQRRQARDQKRLTGADMARTQDNLAAFVRGGN